MPGIRITDHLNAEIVAIDPSPASGLAKYLKGDAAIFHAGFQTANILRQPVALAAAQPLRSSLQLDRPLDLGSNHTQLTLGAGVDSIVDIVPNGTPLFDQDFFGDPIEAPPGKTYVSFSFMPAIRADLTQAQGDLTFGFHAGTSVEMRSCRVFENSPTDPTVGSALAAVLKDFAIPAKIDDLRHMTDGTVALVGGHGTVRISAAYDLATVVNPLATPKLPLVNGQVSLQVGASLRVGGSCEVTGDYQIRAQKTGNKVRLGLYKKAGSQFTFDVKASLGAGAAFGKRDLIKQLLSSISSDPKADIIQLVDAELSDEKIDQFVEALAASVNRSLTLALETEFSSVRQKEAALLYEVDLGSLDAGSENAVQSALKGDFTALTSAEGQALAGIVALRNKTADLRKRKVTLRLNLLGIVNVLKVTELIRSGTVTYEPVTGDLNIADQVSSNKIRISTRPFEADGAKLRRAVMESLVVTAAYKASRLVAADEFTCAQSYFELHSRTNLQTMTDNLEAVLAAGLAQPAEKAALLNGSRDFGVSTFLMETEFDDAAFTAMFLDAAGNPHPRERYESIGRSAMRALVEADPNDFRHIPLADDQLWRRMRESGPPGFGQVLPFSLREPVRRGVIEADYLVIVWWSGCMATAAKALAEMKTFLAGADPATLHANDEFKKRRAALIDALGDAVARNQSQFGDPWGLLAMDAAAGRKAKARAVIVSPRLTFIRVRA